MYIVCATDNKFVQHCAVTIVSILKNNTSKVIIYLLTEGLSLYNEKQLTDLVTSNGGELHIIPVNSEALKNCPMPPLFKLSHISIATYYRLLVSELLPEEIDKVIYLDCDIVVRHSIDDLWNYNIDGYAIGAVYQIADWNIDAIKRLSYPISYGYFNAGVLLINLKYWRENQISGQLFEYLEKNKDKIIFHDQDALNGVLHGKCLRLPCKWNMQNGFFKKSVFTIISTKNEESISYYDDYKNQIPKEIYDPVIVHYVSKPKPWEIGCTHPYKREYYHYLNQTPWYNYQTPNAIPYYAKRPKLLYYHLKWQLKKVIVGDPYLLIKQHKTPEELRKVH